MTDNILDWKLAYAADRAQKCRQIIADTLAAMPKTILPPPPPRRPRQPQDRTWQQILLQMSPRRWNPKTCRYETP